MMKRKYLLVFTFVTILSTSLFSSRLPENLNNIMQGLQGLKGWKATQAPQFEKGEDLFLLINGGAEIYFEYGFKQAMMTAYENDRKKAFNLEIYEMKNPDAAFGVFTFKTQKGGEVLNIGQECRFEDYYLNLLKGRYVITLTGFESGRETRSVLIRAARLLAARIPTKGPEPDLVKRFYQALGSAGKPEEIKFLKGNIALFNYYNFDAGDIFRLKEGLIADFGFFTMFIFKYPDPLKAARWLEKSVENLSGSTRFWKFKKGKERVEFRDLKGSQFYILNRKSYILIYKSSHEDKYFPAFDKICRHLY